MKNIIMIAIVLIATINTKAQNKIKAAWDEHGFDAEDFIQLQKQRAQLQGWKYKHNKIENWTSWAETSITSLPAFLDETFPNWELVEAESELYESIPNRHAKFKGYIDCILKVPNKKGYKYWVLDWKTSSGRGWDRQKQSNFLVQSQVILYKNFWATKNNINVKDIQCGFVLLKKVKTVGKSCQLIKVSSGAKTLEKSNKLLKNMLSNLMKGKVFNFKNLFQTSNIWQLQTR